MPKKLKRRLLKYSFLVKPVVLVGFFMLILIFLFRVLPLYNFAKENDISLTFLASLIFKSDPQLKKYSNRTNIVLMGISGANHDGFDLTDTIILLSVDFDKKDGVMMSIPRDIWLSSLKDKINTAYHYGEDKRKGGGMVLSKSSVEEVVGVPVHYIWIIDFSSFKEIIDLVGGVEVNVENEFDDYKYPIEGKEEDFCGGDPTFACRYEHVHFDRGLQYMNGDTALKFVRSRNSEGEEGTDFARSKRQQKVIMALKDKVFTQRFLKDVKRVKNIIKKFEEITTTDMNWSEKILFMRFFIDIADNKIRRITLDSGDEEKDREGFLINPPLWKYDGVWVLVPRTGNFDEIHEFIGCHLENPACPIKP